MLLCCADFVCCIGIFAYVANGIFMFLTVAGVENNIILGDMAVFGYCLLVQLL